MSKFTVAGVQMDIRLADAESNLKKMFTALRETTAAGAALTVFPECTTTGYCFDSLEEAHTVAEPFDGESFQRVLQICSELSTMVVYGFLESDGECVFNSLALVSDEGLLGRYRKLHLPHLGVDRFTTPGEGPLQVTETRIARIGLNICYDSAFPESARILAIQGADLVTLATNWPPTSSLTADVIPNARALENHVYFMAVNRIGSERGVRFIGKTKICAPDGSNLAFADHADEAIVYAEIDPALARQKHLVSTPGIHEVHRMNDRRPDVYGPISATAPKVAEK
jgi:predicted amidohydrolase